MRWREFISITTLWRANQFSKDELSAYAHHMMIDETKRGVLAMCLLAMAMLTTEAILFFLLDFNLTYLYTCSLLALLSGHIALSTRVMIDVNSLYLLAMTTLIICGASFVLLAQQTDTFSTLLFASVAMLFMIIPMVPWGLREALIITGLIYGTFTISTLSTTVKFDREQLWTLQFIMATASIVSLALVARNVSVRKNDIRARYELEMARNKILILSNKDPLTGIWNRRYLQQEFDNLIKSWHSEGDTAYFSFVDLDNFKPLNDTFGHDYGDQLLRWLSADMKDLLGDQGIAVRMGGDEFALLTKNTDPAEILQHLIKRIRQQVTQDKRASPLMVSISVGIATLPPGRPVLAHEAYKAADNALYQAKLQKNTQQQSLHIVYCTLPQSIGETS